MQEDFSFLNKIGRDPGNLIKGLQAIQSTYGYVSDEGIRTAAEYFGRPEADVEGVISFYAQFKRVKPGKYKIAVCDGTACHVRGSSPVLEAIKTKLKLTDGKYTTPDGLFSLEVVSCLGACGLAPAIVINDKVYPQMTGSAVSTIIDTLINEERK